jgi:hypothetical protein
MQMAGLGDAVGVIIIFAIIGGVFYLIGRGLRYLIDRLLQWGQASPPPKRPPSSSPPPP